MSNINPRKNFEETREKIGYVERAKATRADYERVGFMSGLEVHQQLLTKRKLFCRCPAGIFQKPDQFDAEVVRHMRPTLSELGEYDGTALMEFKTRKEIIYRIANKTACTYEVDDTPPFPIDREALEKAIEIALASKLNIVGEVHITRKQYLDGSIPTGFQRTAIIGIEGSIQIKNKVIRLIQLSLEEDACREVSDIGHVRVYRTDRLGMPLIETVTYPDFTTPDEVKEGCDYIRFLNRSTGKVRTGIGAGREDVNVSCKGGTRVEIKGVAHTKWIPELTHVEVFRQWALLAIRDCLLSRTRIDDWQIQYQELDPKDFHFYYPAIQNALTRGEKLYAVNLPYFKGLLSHFTQPDKPFYDEFVHRLKVIACLEKPNMVTSEDIEDVVSSHVFEKLQQMFGAGEEDAQILLWGPKEDMKTAIEVIDERARMAFEGVPKETRKSFVDGTTIFERVLPGADRMYPDTDSAPIPLDSAYIEQLRARVPDEVSGRYEQLIAWNVPDHTYDYLFTWNYFPLIKQIVADLKIDPKYVATFIGTRLKHLHGQFKQIPFDRQRLYDLFVFLQTERLNFAIAPKMLKEMFQHPGMDFESILVLLKFKRVSLSEIMDRVKVLQQKFIFTRSRRNPDAQLHSLMGAVRNLAEGNADMKLLSANIREMIE
ncbi:MAG: Glu-tRNA(Gln) amidotransferase subunit GatE [Bacteroidales bacterium]|nr:Glu-tRNA(Gln) amidotransferase subunit GatE [Bacteroidales bacterium]